jgi:hypothetical protein
MLAHKFVACLMVKACRWATGLLMLHVAAGWWVLACMHILHCGTARGQHLQGCMHVCIPMPHGGLTVCLHCVKPAEQQQHKALLHPSVQCSAVLQVGSVKSAWECVESGSFCVSEGFVFTGRATSPGVWCVRLAFQSRVRDVRVLFGCAET